MYKIYINETPLLLVKAEVATNYLPATERKLVSPYSGKTKFLLQHIDMLEKTNRFDMVIIHAVNYEQLVLDFMSLYKTIEAAGGVVFNNDEQALLIYRRGFWDLPKGKIDKGETVEAAAIREVNEETGLQNVTLGDFLCKTYHTYKNGKGKRVLKLTHWFKMRTADTDLILQSEEDIEEATWVNRADLNDLDLKIYKNIRIVLDLVDS